MGFEQYDPSFRDAEEVREMLIENGFFDKELSIRSVVLSLEVMDDRHRVGKGKDGYEVSEKHLPVIAQYIDRDGTIPCNVDVA